MYYKKNKINYRNKTKNRKLTFKTLYDKRRISAIFRYQETPG